MVLYVSHFLCVCLVLLVSFAHSGQGVSRDTQDQETLSASSIFKALAFKQETLPNPMKSKPAQPSDDSLLYQENTGNILNLAFDHSQKDRPAAIVQGCNCFGFGGGLSAVIGRYFPEANQVDQQTTAGDPAKLGTYSKVLVEREGKPLWIVNMYTQFKGGTEMQEHLERNIKAGFERLAQDEDLKDVRIFYPDIGCGIAGGNPLQILPIIKAALKEVPATFVKFNPNDTIKLPIPSSRVWF